MKGKKELETKNEGKRKKKLTMNGEKEVERKNIGKDGK
jgi:hypothetical protein